MVPLLNLTFPSHLVDKGRGSILWALVGLMQVPLFCRVLGLQLALDSKQGNQLGLESHPGASQKVRLEGSVPLCEREGVWIHGHVVYSLSVASA